MAVADRQKLLARLFARRPDVVDALTAVVEADDGTVQVRTAADVVVWAVGEGADGPVVPVEVDGETIGEIAGSHATLVAPLIDVLIGAEASTRSLTAETLELYRQINMLQRLSAVLGLTPTRADVAEAVVAELAAVLPGDVGIVLVDAGDEVLAASAGADVPTPRNDGTVVIAPLEVGDMPLGRISAENRDGTVFLSPAVGLVTTAAGIAGAALSQAISREAAQREAERRESELRRTVTELQEELELATTRVLGGLLFTDLVDSTATQARVGDSAWAALIRRHNQETDAIVVRHGGRLIDFTGDGLFAVFDSVSRALRAAAEIRSFIESLGLQVRIGVHAGEIEQRGSQVSGMAVNVGARVMSEATAGEILVTAITAELGAGEVDFETRGTRVLKGVPGEWEVFEMSTAP